MPYSISTNLAKVGSESSSLHSQPLTFISDQWSFDYIVIIKIFNINFSNDITLAPQRTKELNHFA